MGIPFGYVFASSPEERARLRKELEPLAREYRKGIQFGVGDPVTLGEIVEDLHLNVSRWPAFAIREPVANLRYPINETKGSFSNEMKGFVQDCLGGKLKPTIKSEPIPGKSKDGVVKVVGLNYHEIVMDKAKDVLLIYCITPCGPCEALQPTLVALARLYASSPKLKDKVTIAKVMYDDNDLPERGIRGFPTIRLFPAASKSAPVLFLEDRTFDALADFIRDHRTHKGDARDSEEKQIAPNQGMCMYVNGERVCFDTKSDDPEQNGKIETPRHNES
jgi:protein disulfide-isomerase A1